MKLLLVITALTLASLCQCNVLNQRQEQSGQKIIGLSQFEELLRLIQTQISRLSNQFTRILVPRDGSDQPLSKSALDASVQELRNGMKDLNKNMEVLTDQMTQLFGGQDANSNNANPPPIPFLNEFREFIALIQKQFAGFANLVTKTITGGQYLADGPSGSSGGSFSLGNVPVLREIGEIIQLIQKQLNRLGDTVRRTITGEQRLAVNLNQQLIN